MFFYDFKFGKILEQGDINYGFVTWSILMTPIPNIIFNLVWGLKIFRSNESIASALSYHNMKNNPNLKS